MVRWTWWDWSLSLGLLLHSVLWHCWLTYNVFSGTLNPTQSLNHSAQMMDQHVTVAEIMCSCNFYTYASLIYCVQLMTDWLIVINFGSLHTVQWVLCCSSLYAVHLFLPVFLLQYLMHVAVLPDDSLVIVERPLDAVLQSLPDPLHRKKFGV